MFLSDFSIKRPMVVVAVTLAMMIFGYFAMTNLKTNQFPDVQPPVLVMNIPYPGASPETVEREILNRVEDSMATITGMRELRSYARESNAVIVAIFEFDKDLIEASQEMRDAVAVVRDKLPTEMKEPFLRREDPNAQPVMSLALSSTSMDPVELSQLAEHQIAREIRSVPGVALVTLEGEKEREMTIFLNSNAMREANVSAVDVVSALQAQNVAAPVGRVVNGMEEQGIRIQGRLRDVREFEQMVVKRNGDQAIRLAQVADVVDGAAEQRRLSIFNGVASLGINVVKARDASTISVTDDIKVKIAELKKTLPADFELVVVRDSGEDVAASMRNVTEALSVGALLTIVTVFVFLNSWRSTLITSLALPTSVLASFIAVWACGFTLNFMSLLGLSLAIGILIDDAIVVRENIVRHMEMGKDNMTAARDGTREIGMAVIATTMSIVAVFIPIAFLDGITGQWFKPFALTVACSVLVSLFISFTLDPMMSAYWHDPDHDKNAKRRGLGKVLQGFNIWFDHQAGRYSKLIGWALKHRKSMWFLAFGSFIGAIALQGMYGGSGFLPETDDGGIVISVRAPSEASIEYTSIKAEQAAAIARQLPEQLYTQTTVGTQGNITRAQIFVRLTKEMERSRSSREIAAELRAKVQQLVGAEYTVSADLNGGGGGKALQIQFRGPDSRVLEGLVMDFMEKLKTIPGAVDVGLSSQDPKPELQIEFNRGLASSLGLSMNDAANALRLAFAGAEIGDWIDPTGETRNVYVRIRPEERMTVQDLERLPLLSNRTGAMIPLEQIATVTLGKGPAVIEHLDRQSMMAVGANVQGRSFGEVDADAKKLLSTMAFPPGYDVVRGGQSRDQEEVFGSIFDALGLAVMLMYLILVVQFHSFLAPVSIMMSLPLSLIGVVLSLLMTGATLNLMSLIGVVMLMGIVVKNGILLIDCARKKEKEGFELEQALIAAGRERLRPILMTTFALVAGMLPVAIGIGEGSAFYKPLGIAVIGGVITSTVLTLLVVPTFYDSLETAKRKLKARFMGRRLPVQAGYEVPFALK
ncbi:MAG: efflux RND transporter permease subunit [Gammaproteobacteria bacterium]|nr:efflux RND transporter permease subunit [Gammaproteobacteria bacterium]MBU2057170.1 efflux RND transporter permease subunit [Gammaproteobacteria bacterium]MBU2174979.1 efflux RND transporter permease subunit [Gammaproteobacteria bacterium]MBU2246258.1 efflux RND transporter permease subunit [Gammaproteobacteria bacterium]MBU2346141.1 efflux RND transporter permease subunit [Gammaproteobacteria bacterium]